jgi:lysophospholipase L1-like esterase
MKIFLLIIATLLVAYIAYQYLRVSKSIDISSALVADAQSFERENGSRTMLVVGDSTAVGVGSPADSTVAGRLSNEFDFAVENNAMSGARVRDLKSQLAKHKRGRYDLILMQVGANDVIRFTPLTDVRRDIVSTIQSARELSDKVVVLTAGKVGDAPFFPKPFGFLWTQRAAEVREHFIAASEAHGAIYVDLFTAADPFTSDPRRYYAPDGLHLTGDGYEFWYEETRKAIEATWPEYASG